MLPTGPALRLEDSPTLLCWSSEGFEENCGAPWLEEALAAAVERGPHKGVLSEEAIQRVHNDLEYQIKAGFAEIYFWDDLKGDPPSNLKISPVTVIPQPDRRGCIILDLSFPVYWRATRGRRRQIRKIMQEAVNHFWWVWHLKRLTREHVRSEERRALE